MHGYASRLEASRARVGPVARKCCLAVPIVEPADNRKPDAKASGFLFTKVRTVRFERTTFSSGG